ncbi:MAG: lipoyl(octanoyl) transferase LipB [Actinomycetota bacterium]|jgi:lipoyl(octanoyl) transferase
MPEFIDVAFAPEYISYAAGYDMQQKVHADVVAKRRPNTVLLLEHSPVYTAGKRTDAAELPFDGTEFIETNRGGKITWHGPGQLVGYPIMHLPQPIDVVNYVRWMEEVLINVIANFDVAGTRVEGRTGVWVDVDGHMEKVAAIGIRVAEKVTMHGFALNCSNSLEPYENIIACGIADAKTTTLSKLTGRTITPRDAANLVKTLMGEIPSVRI